MDTQQDRLARLDFALSAGKDICSSKGWLNKFPKTLKSPFKVDGVGLVVCNRGNFVFSLNECSFAAKAGQTLFISEDSLFQVQEESEELEVFILFYKVTPIRDVIGNMAVSMYLYSQLIPEPCYVWATGEEEEVVKYMSLLDSNLSQKEDTYSHYERKLLLLALTYRLCAIYYRKLATNLGAVEYRNEVFIRLIQLIEQHYMKERGVAFYADKLCLSPKYLSALCKSISGYTVQELVFKSIIRKSISMLKNTQKNIQEISDFFNFPNASYFGTFFKKQVGVSPQKYRRNMTN